MKRLGLRTRLTLIFSLVFAGILILNTAISYRILKFRLDENLREELKERAAGLSGYLRFRNGMPDFEYNTDDADEAYFVETGTRYYQIFKKTTGELVDQSHELDLLNLETDPESVNEMFGRLAKAIGEMKQFTASISHELRTPLTILRGETEVMLLQAHTIEEYWRLLASHLEEYDRLARLVNGLLTLARAEAGEIRMQPATIDLAYLSQYLVEQLDAVSSSRQISLSIQSEGPVYVWADREWLESAILNLLDNAIKYTPGGGRITVTVENRNAEARLEIGDTGIGIAREAMPHIFERFYRADPSRSSSREGAGLGLSLVQWIVQQHRGRVEVESEPGKGSRFTVCLPTDQKGGYR